MNIELDPKLGVNPHLCICPRCGESNNELVLIGMRKSIYRCNNCDTQIYGHRISEPCPNCGEGGRVRPYASGYFTFVRKIEDSEKIPTDLCESCKKELATFKEIVSAGGVYWRCADCHSNGVIKKNDFAEAVRKKHNLEAPAPCGVEFTKKECPACGPNKVANDNASTSQI